MMKSTSAVVQTRLLAILKKVSFLSSLEDDALREILAQARVRSFPMNTALFHKDDPGHTLYIVIQGRVRIERPTASGEIVHIAHRGPGEYLGELALIDGANRMADAVTASACELLMLDRPDFLRVLETSPQVSLAIMASLASRLREAAERLEDSQELDVRGRICGAILELSGFQGLRLASGQIRIVSPPTQQALADQIGSTRESVSRAISDLRAAKIIQSERRELLILDELKLQKWAGR